MEIPKHEVIRRLREAGFTPDPVPHHLPEPTGIPAEAEGGLMEPPSFEYGGPPVNVPTRPMPRDPKGEPWMVWISQQWQSEEIGPHGAAVVLTHVKLNAAQNQTTYRTHGYWSVGIAIPGVPGPEELLYAIERELSDLAGKSIRVSHFDGQAVP